MVSWHLKGLFRLLLGWSATFALEQSAEREISATRENSQFVLLAHISDVHLSDFSDHSRLSDLFRLSSFLKMSTTKQPPPLIITGDLADSKRGHWSGGQAQSEWEMYNQFIEQADADGVTVLDIPGNHDRFGVFSAADANSDFFTNFSATGKEQRRHNGVYSRMVGPVLCVGMDVTPIPGPNRPVNFHGVVTRDVLTELDIALSQPADVKVVFAHYPTNTLVFPAAREGHGGRVFEILHKHGVSAYLSGHFHALFGHHLTAVHTASPASTTTDPPNSFLEWELSDFKDGRHLRLLAWDQGRLTNAIFKSPKHNEVQSPMALITAPAHASHLRASPTPLPTDVMRLDKVRVVVVSETVVDKVVAEICQGAAGEGIRMGRVELHRVHGEELLWEGVWNGTILTSGMYAAVIYANGIKQPAMKASRRVAWAFLVKYGIRYWTGDGGYLLRRIVK
ncbi:hypothetical protein CYMTET_44156 [Cymbomonas tetramitiformis]|uniref:Calcineurin-like phosphoesterase domain-containing protein n=1 Tax=Cymbomonas tetramitiformis TaxID=36881 RepID=A0AAE0C2P6_9CHLO|nr:hypothetical protein CYMTET_44156 [Cymbomonas tetramitiformis]